LALGATVRQQHTVAVLLSSIFVIRPFDPTSRSHILNFVVVVVVVATPVIVARTKSHLACCLDKHFLLAGGPPVIALAISNHYSTSFSSTQQCSLEFAYYALSALPCDENSCVKHAQAQVTTERIDELYQTCFVGLVVEYSTPVTSEMRQAAGPSTEHEAETAAASDSVLAVGDEMRVPIQRRTIQSMTEAQFAALGREEPHVSVIRVPIAPTYSLMFFRDVCFLFSLRCVLASPEGASCSY
jgi:hypothetical protein